MLFSFFAGLAFSFSSGSLLAASSSFSVNISYALLLSITSLYLAAILDFATNVIKCLGVIEGSQHLEVFVTDKEEIVFLEIGARLPGIIIIKVYEKIFNINLINVEIGLLFNNRDLLANGFKYNNYAFFMMYPYKKGTILKKNALTTSIETTVSYLKEVGDIITHDAKSNLDATSIILGWGADYEAVRHTFFELAKYNPYIII